MGVYTVKLGFSAPPGDKPGERVFDVTINSKTVLDDFDIVKEAGKPDSAIWKEFKVTADDKLLVEFVVPEEKPAPEKMPLVNAIVVLRQD